MTTDARGNILYVHGETGRYLRPAPGPVSNNVVEMAREGLQLELRGAINTAAVQAEPTLKREVSVKTNGGFSMVRFSVRALTREKSGDLNDFAAFNEEYKKHFPSVVPTRATVQAALYQGAKVEIEVQA